MFNVVIRGKLSSTPCVQKYFLFSSSVLDRFSTVAYWDFKYHFFFKWQKLGHMSQPFYFTRRNLIWQITKMAPQLLTFFCEGVSAALRYTRAVCDIAQWVNNLTVEGRNVEAVVPTDLAHVWKSFTPPILPESALPKNNLSSKMPAGTYL